MLNPSRVNESRGNFSPNYEVIALSRIDRKVPILRPDPCCSKRTVKIHVLCPPSHHADATHKDQRHCFEDIREVFHEEEDQVLTCHCTFGRPQSGLHRHVRSKPVQKGVL